MSFSMIVFTKISVNKYDSIVSDLWFWTSYDFTI